MDESNNKELAKSVLIKRAVSLFADELGKLQPRSKAIILYHFDNPSKTQKQLGVRFGLSESRIGQILNCSRVIQLYKSLGTRKLSNLVPESVQTYRNLLKNQRNSPETARKVAESILKENGVLGMTSVRIVNEFDGSSVADLHRFLTKGMALPSEIMDAEVIESPEDGSAQ